MLTPPISLAARSKAYICGRSPAEIVGSNATGGMDVFMLWMLCMLSGRGLCDELITRPEESYRLWCVIVCDLETSRMRRPWPALGRSATGEKNIYILYIYIYIALLWLAASPALITIKRTVNSSLTNSQSHTWYSTYPNLWTLEFHYCFNNRPQLHTIMSHFKNWHACCHQ